MLLGAAVVVYRAAERPRLLARVVTLYDFSLRYHHLNLADRERLARSLAYMEAFSGACAAATASGAGGDARGDRVDARVPRRGALAAEHPTGPVGRERAVGDREPLAVDEHVPDTRGEPVRLEGRPALANRVRVEDCHVGKRADPELAAVAEPDALGPGRSSAA